MFEFSGELTGSAYKYFKKRMLKLEVGVLTFSFGTMFMLLLLISITTGYWPATIAWLTFYLLLLIILVAFPRKKEKSEVMPTKIFSDVEYIVSQSKKTEEYLLFEDVKKIVDYGEFYNVFLNGKYSYAFICQKSLLTQGTLEEFEAHFEGKIERIYK